MQKDLLMTWLKDRLYGHQVANDPAPPELVQPDEQRAWEESQGPAQELLELWRELRRKGVAPPRAEARRVLGLLVEIGFAEGPDTVAAFADGTSQFFSRSGTALIGEDPRPDVEAAVRNLIDEAALFVGIAEPEVGPHCPPLPGAVQFTFLTPSGPLVTRCTKRSLRSGTGRLLPLFEPATELIALKTDFPEQPE
jgi:hypothetical protein